MARVLLFGAAWVLFLAVLAIAVGIPSRPTVWRPERPVSASPPAPASARSTDVRSGQASPKRPRHEGGPPPQAGARYPGWTVTRAYSAHHTMVVEVATDRPTDARHIAAQIVEPLKERYDEVLIYIREPGQHVDDLPARRIQWTPRAGYLESVYGR